MSGSGFRLAALGMHHALGADLDEIWPRLLDGDQSRFSEREDLVPERRLVLGEVRRSLPQLPSRLERYASRNNALCLAALEEILASGSPSARWNPKDRPSHDQGQSIEF